MFLFPDSRRRLSIFGAGKRQLPKLWLRKPTNCAHSLSSTLLFNDELSLKIADNVNIHPSATWKVSVILNVSTKGIYDRLSLLNCFIFDVNLFYIAFYLPSQVIFSKIIGNIIIFMDFDFNQMNTPLKKILMGMEFEPAT